MSEPNHVLTLEDFKWLSDGADALSTMQVKRPILYLTKPWCLYSLEELYPRSKELRLKVSEKSDGGFVGWHRGMEIIYMYPVEL